MCFIIESIYIYFFKKLNKKSNYRVNTVETIQPKTTETKEIYYNEELNIADDPATWAEILSKQIVDYLESQRSKKDSKCI